MAVILTILLGAKVPLREETTELRVKRKMLL